jgi:hypothetical protein
LAPASSADNPSQEETAATQQALGLGAEQIRAVVRSHQGALKACYAMAAQDDPSLKGREIISWTIDRNGLVTDASVAQSTLPEQVQSCIVSEIRTWRFATSDSTRTVTYPW